MKKSFFKKIMILCFAVFGMVMIGNNVFADPNDGEDPGDGDSGGGSYKKSCMVEGGEFMNALAYRCDDPDFPTIPARKCGEPRMRRWGERLDQCW